MVPRPYLACSMVEPNPVFFFGITNGFDGLPAVWLQPAGALALAAGR